MHVWYHQPTISVWRRLFLFLGIPALIVAFITTGLLTVSANAASGINQTMSFQGRLLRSSGGVVPDGYYNMQFKIYQDGDGTTAGDTGGTLKWTETYTNNSANAGVQVSNGFFSVTLGSKTPFGSSIDWNSDTLWLSMNVAGSDNSCSTFSSCSPDGEMLPMKRITSAPYAMNAGQLNGKTSDDFIQSSDSPQDANFNIAGTGTATKLQSSDIDTASAGTLTIGGTNATSVALGADTTVKSSSSSGSPTAFQVQNASGTSVLNVDTQTNTVSAAGLQLQSTTGTDLGSWATSPNSLPVTLTNSSYVTANGYVYVIGGKDAPGTGTGQAVATVYYAKLNSDGSIGSWTTASNPLPATRKNATSVVANGYVYVIGGVDTNNNMESTVYYAKLNGDGSVGTWSTATHALPASIGYSASIVANGYVYVMGGSGFDGGGTVNTVYYAQLNTDGTIGSWTTSSNALPYSPYRPVAVTHGGYAYIMTGWNGSDYDDAYYAKLNTDGTTGTWTPTVNLPAPLEGAQGLVSNDNLYVIGGLSNGPNVNTVYKTTFNSDGSINSWTTEAHSLPAATRGMSLGVANNYVYVIGGDLDSSVTANVYSASLTGGGGVTANSTASNLNLAVGGSIAQSIASDGSVLFQNSTNSATAFVVQNAAGNSLLAVSTKDNNIQIGSATANSNPILLTLNNYNGSSDPTGNNGSMYYSTTMGEFRCFENGAWQSCGSNLRYSSTSASSAIKGNVTGVQYLNKTYTIPANYCTQGRIIHIVANGLMNSAATAQPIAFSIKLGSQVLTTSAATITPSASQSNLNWSLDYTITCRDAIGTSAGIYGQGTLLTQSTTTSSSTSTPLLATAASGTTLDTTADQQIQIGATFTGATSTNNSLTMQQLYVSSY